MCKVPGCLTTDKRETQEVCDCCRKKFIKQPAFRKRLIKAGIIPD